MNLFRLIIAVFLLWFCSCQDRIIPKSSKIQDMEILMQSHRYYIPTIIKFQIDNQEYLFVYTKSGVAIIKHGKSNE